MGRCRDGIRLSLSNLCTHGEKMESLNLGAIGRINARIRIYKCGHLQLAKEQYGQLRWRISKPFGLSWPSAKGGQTSDIFARTASTWLTFYQTAFPLRLGRIKTQALLRRIHLRSSVSRIIWHIMPIAVRLDWTIGAYAISSSDPPLSLSIKSCASAYSTAGQP